MCLPVGCCGLFLTDLAEHCFEEQLLLVTAGIKERNLKMAEWLTDSGFNPGNEIQIKACKSIISPRWRVFEQASCVVQFKSHLPDILLANGALCDLNYPLSTWNLCDRDWIALICIYITNVCVSKNLSLLSKEALLSQSWTVHRERK